MAKEREPRYLAMRGQHATGAELERLVHGGIPGGRREQRRAAHGESTVAIGAPVSAEALLTHAPRPRKKKRRV